MRQKKICICGAFNLLFCNVAYFWCGFSRLVIYCVVFMLYIFLHIHLYTLNSIALCDHSYLHHGNEKQGKKEKSFQGEREIENDSFESSDWNIGREQLFCKRRIKKAFLWSCLERIHIFVFLINVKMKKNYKQKHFFSLISLTSFIA